MTAPERARTIKGDPRNNVAAKQEAPRLDPQSLADELVRRGPATTLQRARLAPRLLSPLDLLGMQRTMGNHIVGQMLASRPPAAPKPPQVKLTAPFITPAVQRMKYTALGDPTTITVPDVNIESFTESQCFLHLAILNSGVHGNIVFEGGDRNRLDLRFQATQGTTLQGLAAGLRAAAEPNAGMPRRNIPGPAQQFVALVDEIRQDGRVDHFAEWLHGNSSKFLNSEEQLLDHLNELREAKRRLALLQGGERLDLGESQIPGSINTADLAYGTTKVEIKTVQDPIKGFAETRGQLLAGLDKFRGVTVGGPYHVVVYASYDARLVGAGIEAKNVRNRLVGADIVLESRAGPTAPYVERRRTAFFAEADGYIAINAPPLVNRVDIRMENGPSHSWVQI